MSRPPLAPRHTPAAVLERIEFASLRADERGARRGLPNFVAGDRCVAALSLLVLLVLVIDGSLR